jgi:hypothetical protein
MEFLHAISQGVCRVLLATENNAANQSGSYVLNALFDRNPGRARVLRNR